MSTDPYAEPGTIAMFHTPQAFEEHLERASQEVRTWPAWRQELLGGTAIEPNPIPEHARREADRVLGCLSGMIGLDQSKSAVARSRSVLRYFRLAIARYQLGAWTHIDLKMQERIAERFLSRIKDGDYVARWIMFQNTYDRVWDTMVRARAIAVLTAFSVLTEISQENA